VGDPGRTGHDPVSGMIMFGTASQSYDEQAPGFEVRCQRCGIEVRTNSQVNPRNVEEMLRGLVCPSPDGMTKEAYEAEFMRIWATRRAPIAWMVDPPASDSD
jgi:hypothetical protein